MAPGYSQIIEGLGKNRVKLNESLAKQTTFGIGGPADLFYEARNKEELIKAVKLIRKLGIPFFILGGGSNLLVSDQGFQGLVMKLQMANFKIQNSQIMADAGVSLGKLVQAAADHSLSGLEIGVGIPGTMGGAIVGNTGTADQWLDNLIESVEILDEENRIQKLTREDCQFGYRTSRFKKTKEIILRVILALRQDQSEKIRERTEAILAKRKDQPKERSAGSIFKNPPGKSAGKLIDQAGLKGKTIGRAQISPQHANFIVNLGGAKANDVIQLIKLAKAEVQKKFGLELEEEICLVGFDKIQG